jgi:D-alanyl-D-alanine carboxypeptidase
MKKILPFFLLFLLASGTFAQTTDANFDASYAQKLQAALSAQGTSGAFYGLSAAIFVPGQGKWIGTFGNSVVSTPITSEMRFCIASNSKSFTAALCLKLQEEGLLSLDDSIGKFLPTFANIDPDITIRQCLRHETGLADTYNDSSNETFDEFTNNPDSLWSPADVMNTIPAPFFGPGQSYYYSNSNYILAGMCCASAANMPLGALLKNRIFDPLLLTKTVLASDGTDFYGEPWAALQTGTGLGLEVGQTDGFNSFIQNAGAIWSTPNDQISWYRALFASNFLTESSRKLLREVEPWSSYAFGVRQENMFGATLRYHAGAWGYRSILFFDENTGITVSILSNLQGKSVLAVGNKLLETALAQRPPKSLDSKIDKIIAPVGNLCLGASQFNILVKNTGTQSINLLQINAEIDGASVFSANVSIPIIAAGASKELPFFIPFPADELVHNFRVSATIPGIVAQGYLEDDVKSSTFSTKYQGIPILDFQKETFSQPNGELPAGWFSHQPTDVQDWRGSRFAGNGGALCRNLYNDANENTEFLLDLPAIEEWICETVLTFDYAYAQYTGLVTADTLEVLFSNDCGKNFTSIWKKGGDELVTGAETTASYLPEIADWKNVKVAVFEPHSENSIFRFRTVNGYGNNIWLDNVGFDCQLSTENPIAAEFKIAPNPMKSSSEIQFQEIQNDVNFQLFDFFGRKMQEISSFSGQKLSIERQNLPAGFYFFSIDKNGKSIGNGRLELMD